MVNKNQRSVNVEQELWDAFGTWCFTKGSNRTKELNAFMQSVVNDSVPPDYTEAIAKQVKQITEDKIREIVAIELEKRDRLRTNQHVDIVDTVATVSKVDSSEITELPVKEKLVEQVEQVEQVELKEVDKLDEQDELVELVEQVEPKKVDKLDEQDELVELVEQVEPTELTEPSEKVEVKQTLENEQKKLKRKQENLALLTRHKANVNKKRYTDEQVAKEVGLSQATLEAFRNGRRKPNSEIIKNWGINSDGTRWVRN